MTIVYKVACIDNYGNFVSAFINGHNKLTYTIGQETTSSAGPIFCMLTFGEAKCYLEREFSDEKVAILECETTDEPVRLYKGLEAAFVSRVSRKILGEYWSLQHRNPFFSLNLPTPTYCVSSLTPIRVAWRTS